MSSGQTWDTLTVDQLAEEIIDYRGKSPTKSESGIPLVTAKIVKSGRIDTPTEFIPEADYDDWMRRGIPRPGDVVITTEAPLGEVAQLGADKVALAQRLIVVRAKPELMANRFLKYALQSSTVQHRLRARATGTTVLGIKQSELRQIEIPIPPLPEQRRIAHILGTLDDKIELNRRMNRTLEAIARAIFKSWFVDFDPVHVKAEGREPIGMAPETAALFPDSFQDSPLGKIPKGWEMRTLGDILSLTRNSMSPAEFPEEEFDHYSIPAFDRGAPVAELASAIKSSKYLVSPSAILVSKLNPRFPRVWRPQLSTIRRSICSTEFLVSVPAAGVPREYLFGLLSSSVFLRALSSLATGTTGSHQRVRPSAYLKMDVPVPPTELQVAFSEHMDAFSGMASSLQAESEYLAQSRNGLLPRLLSGHLKADHETAQDGAEQ